MNPSPWGGFMEGIAGGIRGGTAAYVQKQMSKIDEQQKASIAKATQLQDMFSDKNLPLVIRKKAWGMWLKENKDWNTGIEGSEFSDEIWNDNRLDAFLKRGLSIRNNKNYSLQDQIKFTKELYAEAKGVLGQEAASALKPSLEGLQQQGFTQGVGALQKSGSLTPGSTGLLAGSEEGRKIIMNRMKKPMVKTPAISQYESKAIGGGKTQKFKWNPETKKHDIPFGEPKTIKSAAYHKVGGSLYKIEGNKSTLVQERSIEGQAVANAMNEPNWRFLSEADQALAIQKWVRLLTGKAPPPSSSTIPEPVDEKEKGGFLKKTWDSIFPKQSEKAGRSTYKHPNPLPYSQKSSGNLKFYPIDRTGKKGKKIVATGIEKTTGRKVVKYADGSIEYANKEVKKCLLIQKI